jgi:hypothetical protein
MKRFLVLCLLALVACDSDLAAPGNGGEDPDPALPLGEAAILGHLSVLADDSMLGRRAGSLSEEQAALYIRDEFSEYGLGPATPGYLQEFPLPTGGASQNVLAVLPGQGGLADEWVIIGAHYDHVGYTQADPDSPIVVYNGADDNSSGTALLMEIARYLSDHVEGGNMGDADRRSVMFQAYGAEERGLVGSDYFCANPTVSMANVVAMLNLDMVGRYAQNGLWLIGASSSSDWYWLLQDAGADTLPVTYNETLINRSDQRCFLEAGKPVLFFHTGLHDEYHSPYDDVGLIDTEGMVTVGDVATDVLLQLVVRANPPLVE